MPSIELLAEVELLKDKVDLVQLDADFWKARAEKAESELAALKKDARMCLSALIDLQREGCWVRDDIKEAADRIIAATEWKP